MGTFSAEQYSGECVFLELSESEISADQTVECHHVGIPHEPMAFLEKALQAVHPKDLRRHVDPTMQEVLLDNFHRPPYLLARLAGVLTLSRSTLSLSSNPKQKNSS